MKFHPFSTESSDEDSDTSSNDEEMFRDNASDVFDSELKPTS